METTGYVWENLTHPKLAELREEFELDEVVSSGKTEYVRQVLLKEWLYNLMPKGTPEKDYYNESAFEILRDAKAGKPMWCTQFAFAYLQCAQALGWQARKLSVDFDHEKGIEDHHHGVVDIWSNDHKKWYVVDPLHNLHFLKGRTPLNALEVRAEWIANRAQWIVGEASVAVPTIMWPEHAVGFDTPSNYFWIFTSLRNNFMEKPGLFELQGLLWEDEHVANKRWWRGGGALGGSYEHKGYEGQFIGTHDVGLLFPDMTLMTVET